MQIKFKSFLGGFKADKDHLKGMCRNPVLTFLGMNTTFVIFSPDICLFYFLPLSTLSLGSGHFSFCRTPDTLPWTLSNTGVFFVVCFLCAHFNTIVSAAMQQLCFCFNCISTN